MVAAGVGSRNKGVAQTSFLVICRSWTEKPQTCERAGLHLLEGGMSFLAVVAIRVV